MKKSNVISGVLRACLTGPAFLMMLGVACSWSNAASALTQTLSPTTCASVAGIGTIAWARPTRAISSDNRYATATVNGTTTRYLQCTGYNFAIPAGAIINGITVNVERRSSSVANGGSIDAAMRLIKAGVVGATDRSTATPYTAADVIEAHGGVADLWGTTWLPADINAANFGAAFAATKASAVGAAHTVSVDHVPITITYTILALGPHHINITHAGSALTCSPEIVTITACANAACTAPHYSGGANVTLTPGGQTFAIGATGINSAATVQQSTVGTATLAATSVPVASNAATCWNSATLTASCAMTFNDSGFIVTVPNHTSCNNATATIEAVQTAPGTGRCVPAYQNVTRAVNMYSTYVSPATGMQVITGSTGAVSTAAPGSTHNLAFNANGTATITLSYPDAGQLTLTAGDTAPTGKTMTGSSTFVVAPSSFVFSGIPAAPLTAGQPFNVTVTAMNACATPAATPNFTGTVTLTSGNPQPGIGNATAINAALSGFSNGAASADLTWNEVGTIDMNASLSSYLGWTLPTAVTGTQTGVGRFHPAYFDTTVVPGCATFTYAGSTTPVKAGQPFAVTVTAKEAGGGITANYAGANAYLTTLSNAGVTTGFAGNTIAAANFANGVGSANVTYEVAIPSTAPLTLAMRATDADPTPISSSGHAEAAAAIRSGRAKLGNAYGSELLGMSIPFLAEYWSGNGWMTNIADTCSGDVTLGAGNAVSVTLSAFPATCVQDNGNPGRSGAGCATAGSPAQRFKEGATPGIGFVGDFNLWIKAPGAGNIGTVTVTGNVPAWLQYPWSGGAAINPTARAIFGVYKGVNELIYQRETY
jgi:MSHA biogenesis protein MshQ